jgi:hypothetical protein
MLVACACGGVDDALRIVSHRTDCEIELREC